MDGYRELNPKEIALANKWQAIGEQLNDLRKETLELIAERTKEFGTPDAEDYRWLAIARTHYQQSIQAAKTAVTSPNHNW